MRNNSSQKSRYFIQALAKGLAVLQAFTEAAHPLTLSEIAKELGVNNTTATRLCYTLSELGLLQRDTQRRYHLTPKVLGLGYSYVVGLEWPVVANFYLESLFKEIQETVNLSLLEGREIIYLLRIRKRKYLPFDIRIGTKLPVHCTAMGKVLMALGRPEKMKPILKTLTFQPLTTHTITNLKDFLKELDQVRLKGFAVNDEELSIGNRAVAAPINDEHGFAVAAINLAVPTARYSRKDLEEKLSALVVHTGRNISEALLKMKAPLVAGDSWDS
jgi:IclR family transcriptional regulator, pca regulon regulatory protein